VGVDLDEFARTTLPGLLSFARVLTADRALAEDVVADVVTKLYTRPDRLTDVRDAAAYARRMVVNEYLSWGRKWFRIEPSAQLPDQPTADVAAGVADRETLRGELARLPGRQRTVLVLRYYGGLLDEEIAEELGCSVSTVRSHASRALAALRVEMSDELSPVRKAVPR
jgi:RNA polymerase sigma-70 factor (sigma-E family)